MAASLVGVLNNSLREKLLSCKILVVGAGGIGCELLKNLVLMGFNYIEVIDLDTIDVSNLNRQFLFRKEHVGKSKAQVARTSALQFNPDVTIIAYHDSIMNASYGTEFFQKFDIVMNALDNQAARNHVNRMCLAADVPLIESGTAGYLGQVTVIKKGLTECYECQPKPAQKTYPGCTIRNTPSEPIHCIVWAKHLFNQLYGESDPDQDVSPDTADPEAAGDAGQKALQSEATNESEAVGGIQRKSTRIWAEETGYDSEKLFNKFFRDDVTYLLSMENLWKKRKPPTPLDLNNLPGPDSTSDVTLIRDQCVWSVQECADVFRQSVTELQQRLASNSAAELDENSDDASAMLVWDKDDESSMNFVTSAANLRAFAFGIARKSKFDIKSMAGNIIPAIATTNAIIAGLLVMEGLKILSGQISKCTSIYLNRQPNPRKKLLVPCALDPPNPKCYVCASKPEVAVRLNVTAFTVKQLEDKVLKSALGMVAPDVEIDDGKGTILISSEEGETEDNGRRMLSEFNINTGTRLKCDDFLQEFNIVVTIFNIEKLAEDQEFEIIGDLSKLQPDGSNIPTKPSSSDLNTANDGNDDDLLMVDDDEITVMESETETETVSRKRKALDDDDEENLNFSNSTPHKKQCISTDS